MGYASSSGVGTNSAKRRATFGEIIISWSGMSIIIQEPSGPTAWAVTISDSTASPISCLSPSASDSSLAIRPRRARC